MFVYATLAPISSLVVVQGTVTCPVNHEALAIDIGNSASTTAVSTIYKWRGMKLCVSRSGTIDPLKRNDITHCNGTSVECLYTNTTNISSASAIPANYYATCQPSKCPLTYINIIPQSLEATVVSAFTFNYTRSNLTSPFSLYTSNLFSQAFPIHTIKITNATSYNSRYELIDQISESALYLDNGITDRDVVQNSVWKLLIMREIPWISTCPISITVFSSYLPSLQWVYLAQLFNFIMAIAYTCVSSCILPIMFVFSGMFASICCPMRLKREELESKAVIETYQKNYPDQYQQYHSTMETSGEAQAAQQWPELHAHVVKYQQIRSYAKKRTMLSHCGLCCNNICKWQSLITRLIVVAIALTVVVNFKYLSALNCSDSVANDAIKGVTQNLSSQVEWTNYLSIILAVIMFTFAQVSLILCLLQIGTSAAKSAVNKVMAV